MLKSVNEIWALGFAIHWLAPKSKRPLGKAWSKGPRKTWPELTAQYQDGMNVGVRLGRASKVGEGYLAVIDCDVKSTDPRHLKEMEEKVEELFPFQDFPRVISGRGNGSQHLYCLTPEPTSSKLLFRSKEKVKVMMPSVAATASETAALSPLEVKTGFRLRAAWELSVMGEGSQVVLPPSIHPDSGRRYRWDSGHPPALSDLPILLGLVNLAKDVGPTPTSGEEVFVPVKVDLVKSRLSDHMVGVIEDGDGVTDRSASLMGAALSMMNVGMTRQEILSVLTDRSNFLGETAYDHAKTDSRLEAAKWVGRFTLDKIEREGSAEVAFADFDLDDAPKLSKEESLAQVAELAMSRGFQVERQANGKIANTLRNTIHLILEVSKDMFRRDTFRNLDSYGHDSPWNPRHEGDPIEDIDIVNLNVWFTAKHGFEPGKDKLIQAVSHIASVNHFNPARQYLNSLPPWDGKPRINMWMKDFLNAEGPEPYLMDISRKFLCAMIARVLEPGVQFDSVLILEGPQRCGKSTTARILGGEWFSDAHLDIRNKDTVQLLQGYWVNELGELSSVRKSDVDMLKAFISCRFDRIRPAYGRLVQTFPRQGVFIGTTNNSDYAKDTTGNTRFWSVRVGQCDTTGLVEVRDQLFAEARLVWEMLGEALYLDSRESQEQAAQVQHGRMAENPLAEALADFFEAERKREGGMNVEMFERKALFTPGDSPCAEADLLDTRFSWQLAEALKRLGYERKQMRRGEDHHRVWFWVLKK